MLWKTFDLNKETLAAQYDSDDWCIHSGISLEALGEKALEMLREQKTLPRQIIKANLLRLVLENAQLSLTVGDYFADKINHGNILGNIRDSWFNAIKANELMPVIRENETPGSLRNITEYVDSASPLSVKTVTRFHRANDAERAAGELREAIAGRAFNGFADFSHAVPAWDDILSLGVPGLIKRVRAKRAEKTVLSDCQIAFYDSCEIACEGFVTLMDRYAKLAMEMYASSGDEHMRLIGQSCSNLAKGAPKTTLEALQLIVSFYTLETFVEGVGIRSLGYLDRELTPFYRADIQSGRFTQEQLQDIIKCFYYKFYAMKILANTPFTLAGIDENGKCVCNEVTRMLLDVYGSLDIHDPKIQIRYCPELNDDFIKAALRLIICGNSSIVFMNDETVIRGLCSIGIELKDARKYVPVGCYEPTALGCELPCSCNGRVNIPKAVELLFSKGEDMLNGDKLCKEIKTPESFEEFYAAMLYIVNGFIDRAMALIVGYEGVYDRVNPSPMFSATFASCVEKGEDAYSGGVKYNNSSINIFGVADTVDSLLAVKKLVYDDRTIGFEEFAEILKNDWLGREALRLEIVNRFPKYGNGDVQADALARRLVDDISAMINKKPNGRGGVFRCGGFSIDACEYFGSITSALPDGRRAKDMLSKNMCAVLGADTHGVTGLIHSVTNIDFGKMPNGTVLDVTLHESAVRGDDGLNAMLGTVKAYMKLGGLAIHYNVLNPNVLRLAQMNPEKFKTLQIRLCGWNVYFVNLTREEQDRFISRAEHTRI